MIHPERVKDLNDKPIRPGAPVLYWMQQSQRARWNHALEFAVRQANALQVPVFAAFGLTDSFPEANERHYAFLLEGLADTARQLAGRGIPFVLRLGAPDRVIAELARDVSMVVADRGYLRIQKDWRTAVAGAVDCRVVQVESDVVVPVEAASTKEEYAAATIRPKISRILAKYLQPLREHPVLHRASGLLPGGEDLNNPLTLLARLHVDRTVPKVATFTGGPSKSAERLDLFLHSILPHYDSGRSDPSLQIASNLSPYLHFGQISALEICMKARKAGSGEAVDSFIEELVVRRELAMNFVEHNSAYDSFDCLPNWARLTLDKHRGDPRPHHYTLDQLEAAETHDVYWNAAQREMVVGGKMHNYMRMYWGKKILEWTPSPEEAFAAALYLNNKYELDGRDANSFAGVAWCFGKHDRPWGERPVFGQVRYMNAAGLKRKFKMDGYLAHVASM